MGMIAPSIDIVVVTHNSKDVIERTLRSIAMNSVGMSVRTWVVDNKSTDGGPQLVRERCGWVSTLELGTNDGFAAGCNIGTELGTAPLVLFLNPDCVLQPGALRRMQAYLNMHPEACAVGPAQISTSGSQLPAHQAFPTVAGEFERTFSRISSVIGRPLARLASKDAGQVDWISGACMMIRRSALEQVGPFDEGFFLYFEETDWCLRATAMGHEVHHDPSVAVEHACGTSVKRSDVGGGTNRASSIFVSSRRRYFRKHHGLLATVAVEILHKGREMVDALKLRLGAGVPA